MINNNAIIAWGIDHPWPTRDQVEQDLLLSQALCEIACDPLLGNELVLRGGTAFHKLFLPKPFRYSEDLDYVRSTAGGIGEINRRFSALGESLGYATSTKIGKYPKVVWKAEYQSGRPLKIKIEMNTYERSPAFPLESRHFKVDSTWYAKDTGVRTFQAEELVATKLRALYQRSKGRDLLDIWLALTVLQLNPGRIIKAFAPYRPDGYTAALAIKSLRSKLDDPTFKEDTNNLVSEKIKGYDIAAAGEMVIEALLAKS